MKKAVFAFALVFLFFAAPEYAVAQLSKQERREWKRKKRKASPEEFKRLVEQNEQLNISADSLARQIVSLQQEITKHQETIGRLQTDQTRLNRQINGLKNELADHQEEDTASPWDEGVAFRVQLGAFKGHDISEMVADSPDLKLVREDGLTKYVLGQFRKYDKADELKRYLRRVGVRHTWIVPYKDGKRVPLKEVLDEVLPPNPTTKEP